MVIHPTSMYTLHCFLILLWVALDVLLELSVNIAVLCDVMSSSVEEIY